MKRVVVAAVAILSFSAQAPPAQTCKPIGRPQFLPAVPEASGVAEAGGALWTHNDSGPPVLFRLDASAPPTAVTVAGADVRDWEDLASASCTPGTCLYIADIGDNRGSRERITIYEVPVPASGTTSTKPSAVHHLRYPDHPHDAEALLVVRGRAQLKLSPSFFVITKEVPARVYELAAQPKPGETGTLRLFRTLTEKVRITGAALSADERWIALRSNTTLLLFTLDNFTQGDEPLRIDLRGLKEPQGEGVAFRRAGELWLVSEGGGSDASGMFTRIHCAFIR